MEEVLYDFQIARAMAQQYYNGSNMDFNQSAYFQAMLKKHHITEAEFDSSLVYYYGHADEFVDMYSRIASRLNDDAIAYGATAVEIGKYSSFSEQGDTANIWRNGTTAMLMPKPSMNRMDFEVKTDTTFHIGDSFQFNFMATFMYSTGMKDATIHMAVKYDNDSISTHTTHCTVSGISTLRIPSCMTNKVKEISGFIYLARNKEDHSGTSLLFIDQIQFIRFHQKVVTPPVAIEPVVRSDSQTSADTLKKVDVTPTDLKPLRTPDGNHGNAIRQDVQELKPIEHVRRP